MNVTSMRSLLEAGVHFGHKTSRWNPKMAPYIFMRRSKIHIIDLKQTLEAINQAYYFLRELARKNKHVLFVGTKKQSAESTKSAAEKCGEFYITKRWYGGLLTNINTIRKSIKNLDEFENLVDSGEINKYTKLEALKMERKYNKLLDILGGVRKMESIPSAVVITDTNHEEIGVKEAQKLGIPIVALVDTNSNPDGIDFVIPANDDAMKSLHLLTDIMANAILEGKQLDSEGADITVTEMTGGKEKEEIAEEKSIEKTVPNEKLPKEENIAPEKVAEVKIAEEKIAESKPITDDKPSKIKKETKPEKEKIKKEKVKKEPETFECPVCKKTFSSKRGLKIHMGLVHQK